MGKLKKLGIGIGIVILGFFVLVIVAAMSYDASNPSPQISSTDDNSKIENANRVIGISEFSLIQRGSVYQGYFSLTGEHAEQLSSDVKAVFVVKRDDGSTVYSQNFNVDQDDFKTYQRSLTGASFYAYLWQFDAQKISHGEYELLTAHLTVTLPNGKTYTADTTVF